MEWLDDHKILLDNGINHKPEGTLRKLSIMKIYIVELLKLIILLCTFDIEKGFILCFAKRLVRPNSVAKLRNVKLVLRLPTGEIISARSV